MSVYGNLQQASSVIAELKPALDSLHMCAGWVRRKHDAPLDYPHRTLEELVIQMLDAEARLQVIAHKLS